MITFLSSFNVSVLYSLLESEAYTVKTLLSPSDDRSNCVYPDIQIYAAEDKSYSNVTTSAGFKTPKVIRRRSQPYPDQIQLRTDTVEG